MHRLVQIQVSENLRRQIVGTLPVALTDPDSSACEELIEPAFDAVDNILRGIEQRDSSLVQQGKRVIQKFVPMVKHDLCASYRYPNPPRQRKNEWRVLCQSGESGEFLRPASVCLNCVLFNEDNRPVPYQLPIESVFPETIHEAR